MRENCVVLQNDIVMQHPSDKFNQRSPGQRTVPINTVPVMNRISEFLEHSMCYAFKGESRLARDCNVSEAAVSRLINGKTSPSFALIIRITKALEQEFKRCIDPREIISLDGLYPTSSVCELVGCKGCTPQSAWNDDDTLKKEYLPKEGR